MNRIVLANLPAHQCTKIALEVELDTYFQRLFGISVGRFALYTEGNTGVAKCIFPSYYHERFLLPAVLEPGVDLLGYKIIAIKSAEPWDKEAFVASIQAQIRQLYYH